MKIHEYNEMMSYLTRPAMKTGGQVIGKPGGLVEPGVTNYGARMYAAEKAIEYAPKIGSQIVKAGQYLKNILASRKAYTGAEKIGVSTPKTDWITEKTFTTEFKKYMKDYFHGNFKAASKSIGENREKIRGIFNRLAKHETGQRTYGKIATGSEAATTLDIPLGTTTFKELTTDLKYKPEIITEKIKKLIKQGKVSEKNFYNSKDLANILGIDSTSKYNVDYLINILKQNNVLTRNISPTIKEYNLGDVSKKIRDWSSTKLVKGDRRSATERLKIEKEWDLPLTRFLNNITGRTRYLSKDTGIFVRNAVEDVGHAQSIKMVSKYPNLFKNSNVKSMQTLTYQDPHINQEIFQKQGFQATYDNIFKELNEFVNKKVTKENIGDLNLIRNKLKENHANLIKRIKTEAKDNSYFKGQEKRIPEVKLSNLKIGDTFKSENIFADMSTIDSRYIVGQISKINPTAKKFSDLTPKQVEWYKQGIKNQTIDNLEKFYKQVGYSADEIEELKDALEIGSANMQGLNEGGRVGLAEGTSLWGKTKKVGSKALEKIAVLGAPAIVPGWQYMHTKEALEEGKSLPEATVMNPWNYLELAFMDTLAKAGKLDKPGIVRKFLRLGLSPKTISTISKRFGIPGLVISTSIEAVRNMPEKPSYVEKSEQLKQGIEDYYESGEHFDQGGRVGFDQGTSLPPLYDSRVTGADPTKKEPFSQFFINYLMDQNEKGYMSEKDVEDLISGKDKKGMDSILLEYKKIDPEKLTEWSFGAKPFGEEKQIGFSFSKKFNEGGRVGFAKGPKDPTRRLVLKGLGALAVLPIVGRFFKAGKFLEKAGAYTGPVIEKVKGMPEWLPSLVKRLWKEGDDVSEKMAYRERVVVKRGTLEGGDDVDLIYEMDTGNVSIDVTPGKGTHETSSGAFNKEYSLDLTKGEEIATKKGSVKTPDEFKVVETEPVRTGHPEDPDWDWDGIDTTVDDAMSDLTELEAFAKKKTTKQIHTKKGTKKKDVFPEVEYDDSYDPETGIHYLDD